MKLIKILIILSLAIFDYLAIGEITEICLAESYDQIPKQTLKIGATPKQSKSRVQESSAGSTERNEPGENREDTAGGDIERKIRNAFGQDAEIAIAIAKCESQLNPKAIGDTHMEKYSYGLFQINQTWHKYSKETLLNPDENIKIAKGIKDKYGWTQWSTFKNGCYLTKLNQ